MEPRRINNSEIQSFKRCKRKWMLEYFLGLTSDEQSSALYTGSLVHKGLEDYYSGGNILTNVNDLITGTPDDVLPADELMLAFRMLEGYPDWAAETGVDAGLEVLSIEEKLEYEFPAGTFDVPVILQGRSDMKLQREGQIGLIDHKTVQNFGDFTDRRLQLNEQLLTYSVLSLLNGQEISWAAINMLRKVKRTGTAKPPFYAREYVTFNKTQLRAHYFHLTSTISDLLKLESILKERPVLTNAAAYPTVDKDCTWKCPFLAICPFFDDGSDIEGALELYKVKETV